MCEYEYCNKKFAHKSNLVSHVKSVHEKLKNYICKYCGNSFGHSSSLKQHIRTLHEGVIYKCDICDKTFNRTSSLNNHSKICPGKGGKFSRKR